MSETRFENDSLGNTKIPSVEVDASQFAIYRKKNRSRRTVLPIDLDAMEKKRLFLARSNPLISPSVPKSYLEILERRQQLFNESEKPPEFLPGFVPVRLPRKAVNKYRDWCSNPVPILGVLGEHVNHIPSACHDFRVYDCAAFFGTIHFSRQQAYVYVYLLKQHLLRRKLSSNYFAPLSEVDELSDVDPQSGVEMFREDKKDKEPAFSPVPNVKPPPKKSFGLTVNGGKQEQVTHVPGATITYTPSKKYRTSVESEGFFTPQSGFVAIIPPIPGQGLPVYPLWIAGFVDEVLEYCNKYLEAETTRRFERTTFRVKAAMSVFAATVSGAAATARFVRKLVTSGVY